MVRRRERTTAGEVTVALALGSFGLPVAVAVGSSMRLALSATLAWWVCSAALTGVGGLIGRARADGSPRAAWLAAAGSIAGTMTLMAFASLGWTAPVAVAAVLPPTIVTVALAGRPAPSRHLQAVGWTLMATSVAVMAILVAGSR